MPAVDEYTSTTNLSLKKPDPGAAEGEWGNMINEDLDTIDSQIANRSKETAQTNTVAYPTKITHTTTGTPANGIGVGIEFEQETSASNNEVVATIEAEVTDTTATSEDADIVFKTMSGGASASEALRINSAGGLDFSADSKGVFNGLESVVWRMVNNESTGSQNPLGGGGSDWEISDDTENEFYLGSSAQVTESSGIFSFASTGYYILDVMFTAQNNSSADVGCNCQILSTDDNGTAWTIISQPWTQLYSSGSVNSGSGFAFIKVSDISNDKIKLAQSVSHASTQFTGGTTQNNTAIRFTKLADL